jgi:hypothetical protein
MFRKPLIVLILLCLPAYVVFSQQRQGQGPRRVISGKVVDSTDNQPMPMVQVGISEQNNWTVTNMEGHFNLPRVPDGKHVLTVRCLGYTTIEKEFTFPDDTELNIKLTPASLALGEVIVTAQRGTGISTSTTLGKSAIEHLQPSDITEVMQLLPGQVSVNPNLSGVSQMGIREITGSQGTSLSNMASLGTGLRIDGAPISNIANMQYLSNAAGASVYQSTAMQGADMRQLSVDNIESIEVVRGIPGVEEGDVLSGVVRVNLIKGRTPLTTRVKVDPTAKLVNVGKGFNLPGKMGGTLNMNVDYGLNHNDITTPFRSYNRFSTYLAYNNTFFRDWKPLSFSVSGTFGDSRSVNKNDPDRIREEVYSMLDQSIRLTTSGRWALNSAILTNLNINISGSLQKQETYQKRFRSFSSVSTLPISFETGYFEAPYLLPLYYSEVTVDGRPQYFDASISGTRTFKTGSAQHTLRAGIDYNVSVNKGEGSIYDILQPPVESGIRPRPYYDIPALHRLAYYFAEELNIPIGNTTLEMQAGIRFNNLQPDGIFSSEANATTLDPRFNIRYRVIDRRESLLSKLGFRFGVGLMSTPPTLGHLYPDKMYRDVSVFNYFDPPNSLAVIYTDVVEDTRNYNLKPARGRKTEGGLDLVLGGIDMQFTGYYEVFTGGFAMRSQVRPMSYNVYQSPGVAGLSPRFIPEIGVVYDDPVTGEQVVLPTETRTVFRSVSSPQNDTRQIKYGLEFDMNFGRIDFLHTDFSMNGAYMYSYSMATLDAWQTSTNVRDQVYGLFKPGQSTYYERIASSFRTVTHIRPLAMVVSLTVQALWMEKRRNIHEDVDGNILVYTLEPTDNVYDDITQIKYYNPIAVLDINGNLTPWQPEYADIMPYAGLIQSYNSAEHFIPYIYKPAFQLNMRLTKELSRAATISFIVNNLTYYQPLQEVKGRIDSYTRRNARLYFSGELTIKI